MARKKNFFNRLGKAGDVLGRVLMMYMQQQRQQNQLELARQFQLEKQERAYQNNLGLAELSARLADERQERLFTHQKELAKARVLEKAKTIQERKKNKQDADKFQEFVTKNKLYSTRIASLTQAIKGLEVFQDADTIKQRNRYAAEINSLFAGQAKLYEEFGMIAPVAPPSISQEGLTKEDLNEMIEKEKFGEINPASLYLPDRALTANQESSVFKEGESPEKLKSVIKMLESTKKRKSQETSKKLMKAASRIKELQFLSPESLNSRRF